MIFGVALWAMVLGADAGATGFSFLKVTPTAQEAALGGTGIGVGGAFGMWYSPANLAEGTSRQLGVAYISYPAGVQSGNVSLTTATSGLGIGLGGYYLNSGVMRRTDERGTDYGPFTASNLSLGAALAKELPGNLLAGGVGLKFIYGGIDTFWSIGLGLDIGVNAKLQSFVPGLRAGLVARNLGLSLKPYLSEREQLPVDLGLGLGYEPFSGLRLALETHKPIDGGLNVRLGAEIRVHQSICLRFGTSSGAGDLKTGGGEDILAGLSAGLGIRHRQLELDYAFTPMVVLSNAHRLSLRYTLGAP